MNIKIVSFFCVISAYEGVMALGCTYAYECPGSQICCSYSWSSSSGYCCYSSSGSSYSGSDSYYSSSSYESRSADAVITAICIGSIVGCVLLIIGITCCCKHFVCKQQTARIIYPGNPTAAAVTVVSSNQTASTAYGQQMMPGPPGYGQPAYYYPQGQQAPTFTASNLPRPSVSEASNIGINNPPAYKA